MTEQESIRERLKYVGAFNRTMIKIWKERIALLRIVDTGVLYRSVIATRLNMDGKVLEVSLSQAFATYGIFQDYGTGRETPRGNSGDIGRAKVRQPRPWFSKKYYASVMNLKEFMADSLGRQFIGIVADALDDKALRQSVTR